MFFTQSSKLPEKQLFKETSETGLNIIYNFKLITTKNATPGIFTV